MRAFFNLRLLIFLCNLGSCYNDYTVQIGAKYTYSVRNHIGSVMCRTFIDPKACGFGKVAAFYATKEAKRLKRNANEGTAKFGARCLQERFRIFRDAFSSRTESFEMNFLEFNKKFPSLQATISKWSPRKKKEKELYLTEFSVENWLNLSEAKKREHTLFDCKGCHQNYPSVQALFPVKSPRLQKRAKENPFVVAKDLAKETTANVLVSKTQIKETAKALYDSINPVFESVSGGISFAEALSKVPATNLEIKKSKTEKKAVRRNIIRDAKENVEANWRETSLTR